jgi:glycine betaine/proline transport system ATP-binding protein
MRDPDTVVYSKDGARIAVRKMKEASISSIFVTDRERHLKGILTIDDATNLLKSGKDNLDSIIHKDISTVSPDTAIEDLMQYFINSKYPVAVTDEENKLLGIIFKVSVLAGILGEDIVNV